MLLLNPLISDHSRGIFGACPKTIRSSHLYVSAMPESDQVHSDPFQHLLSDFYKPKIKKCSDILYVIYIG